MPISLKPNEVTCRHIANDLNMAKTTVSLGLKYIKELKPKRVVGTCWIYDAEVVARFMAKNNLRKMINEAHSKYVIETQRPSLEISAVTLAKQYKVCVKGLRIAITNCEKFPKARVGKKGRWYKITDVERFDKVFGFMRTLYPTPEIIKPTVKRIEELDDGVSLTPGDMGRIAKLPKWGRYRAS